MSVAQRLDLYIREGGVRGVGRGSPLLERTLTEVLAVEGQEIECDQAGPR